MADDLPPNPFAPSAVVAAEEARTATWPARVLAILSTVFSLIFLPGAAHLILGNRGRALRWMIVSGLCLGLMVTAAVMGWGKLFVGALSALFLLTVAGLLDVSLARAKAPARTSLALGLAVGLVAVGIGVGQTMRATLVKSYQIPANSMAPTLIVGDLFMAAVGSRVQRGDVIVFAFPNDRSIDYVKRVVAVGGDTVEVKNDVVLVNGQALPRRSLDAPCPPELADNASCTQIEESTGERHYLIIESTDLPRSSRAEQKVPDGHVFVLGDNRHNSNDSRYWGFVPVGDVRGRASVIWWSRAPDGVVRWDRIGRSID